MENYKVNENLLRLRIPGNILEIDNILDENGWYEHEKIIAKGYDLKDWEILEYIVGLKERDGKIPPSDKLKTTIDGYELLLKRKQ